MRWRKAGIQCERLFQQRLSFVIATEVVKSGAQVIKGLDVLRVQCDGLLKARHSLLLLTKRL